jgi:S1-C subfamily serine protease
MRVGDAILEAGGRDVTTAADFRDAVEDAQARGRKALLVFVASQGGQRRYAALEIEDRRVACRRAGRGRAPAHPDGRDRHARTDR